MLLVFKETRQKLIDVQSRLVQNKELSKSQQKMLDDYLYSIYDKSHEIHQTRRWINTFRQNDGFGITCGVVNFEPQSLEFKTPMDIIGKAGKVLKNGKEKKKRTSVFRNRTILKNFQAFKIRRN